MKKRTLVLGNPGCGKTHNLVESINSSIKEGYKPWEIMVLSHTRVAAQEITNRASGKGIHASTIHSLAYSIAEVSKESVITGTKIKEFSESIGIPMKGSINSDDFLELGDEYLGIVNYAAACGMPLEWAYNEKGRPGNFEGFRHFYENYNHWKKSYGFIDFSDMIDLALKSKTIPENLSNIKVMMVDEAQDLSKSQWKLIDKISTDMDVLIVTGDPDQSLFIWGGADQHGMLNWAKKNNAEIKELRQSYRVPSKIHELSKEVISKVKNRYKKDYIPTDKAGSIERYLTIDHYKFENLKSGLILYRNHALRNRVEEALIHNNIAYITLNGYPSPCQNKWGRGIRAWINIKNSEFPDNKDVATVKAISTPEFDKILRNNDLDGIKNISAVKALNIPYHMLDYYRHVDFSLMNNIKLSTIHGAKGMEDDTVVLINGLTNRVMEEALKKPDPEFQVWYVGVTRSKDKLHIIDGEGVYNPL